MTTDIHSTAIIEEGATLGQGVKIGAYCHIGASVTLGDNVELKSHVVVDGLTSIGEGTIVYPFASLGHAPQDLKFRGEVTELIIGARNKIREHVTMNPGTADDKGKTVVGDDCLFMMASHVAHDCVVGNNVIMANNATLAGHVEVGDFAIIGGLSAVHQFVRIGPYAMIGGMSGVEHDVIPYGLVKGERAGLAGINMIGLERRGFSRANVKQLLKAYKHLFYQAGTLLELTDEVAENYADEEVVMNVIDFIKSKDNRALCRPLKKTG